MQGAHDQNSPFRLNNALPLWTWLSLVTFLVMLTHQSDAPILLGRYSTLVSLTLAGLLLATVVGWGLSRAQTLQERLMIRLTHGQDKIWWALLIYAIAGIMIVGIIFFFLGNFPPQYAFLRAYLVISVLLWALTMVGNVPSIPERWGIGLALGAGLVILGGMVLVADIFPPLARTDEAFVFSMGRNFAETGSRSPMIYAPAFGYNHYVGWVWYRALGTWLATFGETLYSARLHVLTLVVLISIMLGVMMRRLHDLKAGAVVFLLALFTFSQLIYIRFDMYASVWASLSLLIYAYVREKDNMLLHIAIGFCAGMIIDSSPAGFAIGVGYAIVYGLRYMSLVRRDGVRWWSPFWGLALGGSLAIMVFMFSLQPDSLPKTGYEGGLIATLGAQVANNLAPQRLLDMLNQMLRAFWGYQPVLSILAIVGILWGLRRGASNIVRDSWVMLLVWLLAILIAYPYFPRYYLLFGLPIVVLVALPFMRHLPTGGVALLALWLMASLVYGYINRGNESLEDVVRVGERIAEIVPQDAVVVGAEPYYFGMLEHENFLGGDLESYTSTNQNISPEEVWQQVVPDAFIFSGNWSHEPARTDALETYMQTNAFHLAGCWRADSYGRIELWTRPDIAPLYEGDCNRVE
jgi:hypothetical protein